MVLRFLRNGTAFVAVAAYVALAVGGHALHDATCDHDHGHSTAVAATSPVPSAREGRHDHGHHHHGHSHHGHAHRHTAPNEQSGTETPQHRHGHPPQPQHDHDCLICHFVAMTMAIVADATELPEVLSDTSSAVVVVPCESISRPFSGTPRAPPA